MQNLVRLISVSAFSSPIHALQLVSASNTDPLFLSELLSPLVPHSPFGFSGSATGGSHNSSPICVVSNITELREALALPFSKTAYVIINGTIHGNHGEGLFRHYIDMTGDPGAEIRRLHSRFQHQHVVLDTQKAQVGFTLTNNASLIVLDENAALNGINLQVYSVDNIWIRNLKLVSPQDLFSTPVTFPSSWNVEYVPCFDQLDGEYVEPDIIDKWQVDRFDVNAFGRWNEGDRPRPRPNAFHSGNHSNNSASRNPHMRFGTFDVFANVYETLNIAVKGSLPADALFEYNLGVHNQSTVQLQDNVFIQTDSGADDNYISTISEATLPEFYNTPSHFLSTFRQAIDNLTTLAQATIDLFVELLLSVQ
ncbi:polysaccharide lyase family 1 protein [Lentinula detonsa]|uniref:Polysaccharide lyase family 1 protein n=1 Tax=Lentinula detonsa TaxID=2804962 RepID=A0AA38Q3Y3_9AGAR|nr:polysaccharide lyase family 1 protein [Lentinula detonsa]